jgi:phosphoglycolate phosphatase
MADLKLSSVRALIFDLDGTLIDSKRDLIRSVNAMLRELRREELAEETISGYIGHGAPQLVARAIGNGSTEEERRRALQFFLSYYEEHKMDSTCAYPGVAETLEQLARMPMAVLTNKPVRISVRILNELGLSQYFRAIYGGNSFETKKPDPLGARTILRELGAAPGEALLVGDSEVDVHDRGAYPADIYLERFDELVTVLGCGSGPG